jgi:hypothetical protein
MWIVIWRNMLGKLSTYECRSEKDARQVLSSIMKGGMAGVYQKIDF